MDTIILKGSHPLKILNIVLEVLMLANPINHWQQHPTPRFQSHAHEENVGSIKDITAIDLT
jgi:hypothetical protein